MSDLLSRRGFGKLALAAGAGLYLPALARAQERVRMSARIEAHPSAGTIAVDLFVTLSGTVGIELPSDAIHLHGELILGTVRHPFELQREQQQFNPMTRMIPMARPVMLPPGREQLFGRFNGPLPQRSAPATGTLDISTVLDIQPTSRPVAERGALAALGALHAQTRVALGA